MPQGKYFSTQEIDRIKNLLSTTDLALRDIATRMNCAKSSIVSINRNFHIREYAGRRSHWACSTAQDANALSPQPADGRPSWPSEVVRQIVDDDAEAA